MLRGILRFGGVTLVVLVALLTGLQKSGKVDVFGLLGQREKVDESFQRGFRSDAMGAINRIRQPEGVDQVGGDEEIQTFLQRFVSDHREPESMDLDEVFDALQTTFPGAQYLAANLITSRTREDLLTKFSGWTAVVNPDFDTVNTAVFHAGSQIGVIGVMSRRIPEFSLQTANERGGRFFNRCPHCSVIHALELDRDSRTLILSCPHCDLPFDVLAINSEGVMKRANQFMDGFNAPGDDGGGELALGEARVVELWGKMADRCEYELDQERRGDGSGDPSREVWKTSSETWAEASGDCEDTSILLADMLIAAGFEARVAIGWNGNIGQHAWVVVRVGERQYILESTLQKAIELSDLVAVEDGAAFYQPEQMFDRENLYYTTARPDHFRMDYFSRTLWKRIPENGDASDGLSLR